MQAVRKAFTLVEILIVVVILGILASIVIPQFTSATSETERTATLDQLTKIRNALDVYQARNNEWPTVVAGDGTWGELIATGMEYLREPPRNRWVPASVGTIITIGTDADPGFQTTHGWVYDPNSGRLWAGSFDGEDQAYPR